jgi:flavin reductase (DIM6/NTAB) family NADH-FMN oxidoreductase RutF
MKKDFGNKPLIYPQPVLIIASYNEDGTANAMNAAWGAVCDYTKISIILDKNHKTVKNIKEHKAFTVSVADVKHLKESDFFGITTGNKITDKVTKAGLTYS